MAQEYKISAFDLPDLLLPPLKRGLLGFLRNPSTSRGLAFRICFQSSLHLSLRRQSQGWPELSTMPRGTIFIDFTTEGTASKNQRFVESPKTHKNYKISRHQKARFWRVLFTLILWSARWRERGFAALKIYFDFLEFWLDQPQKANLYLICFLKYWLDRL